MSKNQLLLIFTYIFLFNSTAFSVDKTWIKADLVKGVSSLLPVDFVIMSDDDIAQKYPTYKKPLAMYNSGNKEADLGLNFAVNKWNNHNLMVLRDIYKSTILSVFNHVDFMNEGEIKTINGRNFIVFEFVSELIDDKRLDETVIRVKKYTYLMYTLYENKILIFNFTCAGNLKDVWAPTASRIMYNIKISDKLKIVDFVPKEVTRPEIQKKNDQQLNAIRKLKNNKIKNQE